MNPLLPAAHLNRVGADVRRLKTKNAILLSVLLLPVPAAVAGHYTNFTTAIYTPVSQVRRLGDAATLQAEWDRVSRQLKVDKVYLEVQRDRNLADDDLIERVKRFFESKGVRVAGGMALSDGGSGQFRSFCYTDPQDRAFVKGAAELAARHFDELIQDDFFFVTTKHDSDIAAKGNRSWTQFRLDLMREASENLILKPTRAVRPGIRNVIKFPNWYEHFQGLGYDLEMQPRMFDGIYTGTETRDPEITDQNLQPYGSYLIFRYFENIKPGGNGGGWVDTFSVRYVDRYVEQLRDTLLAKPPELMLFEWSAMSRPIQAGDRAAWRDLPTSFDYERLLAGWQSNAPSGEPTIARVAAHILEEVDRFAGRLGKPIGIKSYKPFHSTGEDFLHDYLGMIGIPIDLCPVFPVDADVVLLTECAKADPEIIAKIKRQLAAGKSVVITSGLLRALQGRGIEDIVELQYTDRKILAHQYDSGFGAGSAAPIGGEQNPDILFPDIRFLTNDAWCLVRALAAGKGYPLLLMDRYSKGVLYVWTMPDNVNDLYRLPPDVISSVKNHLMTGFPVRLDGPSRVALYAYDNDTFAVASYLAAASELKVSATGQFTKIRNLLTGQVITGSASAEPVRRRQARREPRVTFNVPLLPHSYAAFELVE